MVAIAERHDGAAVLHREADGPHGVLRVPEARECRRSLRCGANAPQVHRGVRPPRAPRLRRDTDGSRGEAAPRPRRAPGAARDRPRGTRRDRAPRASRRTPPSTGRCPRSRRLAARRARAGARRRPPRAPGRGSPRRGRAAARSTRRRRRPRRRGDGKRCVSPSCGRRPPAGRSAPRGGPRGWSPPRRSPAGRGWRARRSRRGPTRRARAAPGGRATEGARRRSRARWASMRCGSASRSNRRAHAGDQREELGPRDSPRRAAAGARPPGRGAPRGARPARRRRRSARTSPPRRARRRGWRAAREEREELVVGERRAVRQAQHEVRRARSPTCRRAARPRSSLGVAWKASRTASLKRRRLAKPAAWATSVIGERRLLEQLAREVGALGARDGHGGAPRCWSKRRRRCRAVTPRRSASASMPASSRAPSSMRRSARATVAGVPSAAGVPGEASGRHRRHGRSPSACAAAAQWKKRTLRRRGVRAGQPGRQ